MSYGIYCISSDCQTGPKDIIRLGINGKLYPVGDSVGLAGFLQEIIDGKSLPSGQEIKDSIYYLYDEAYISNVKTILQKVCAESMPNEENEVVSGSLPVLE